MSTTISIVIPAYNAERFIAQTLDSVLAQTVTQFEVIVVNDGSMDRTQAIVEQYLARDDRVRLINQENQGISATRQRGQDAAKGDLIAFLDADDLWLPENLQVHLRHFADNPKLAISFGRVEFMQTDGTPTGVFSTARLQQIEPEHLFYENLLTTTSNAIVRREVFEAIGGFDFDLCGTEDQEFFLRARCHGWEIKGVENVLVRYRITPGGLSSRLNLLEADWVKFRQKVEAYAPDIVAEHGAKSYAYFLRYIARRSLRMNSSQVIGIQSMQRALKADWTILLEQPRRTLLTLLAVYFRSLMPN
jgi:glycosyltransferase involved in cell wall biosynthesis